MKPSKTGIAGSVLLVTLLFGNGSGGAWAVEPGRVLEPADVFRLQWVSDPQIRNDGGAVAYVRNANDIQTDEAVQTIWVADTATGSQKQIGSAPGMYGSPRWSPDGKRLAYLFSASGSKKTQLLIQTLQDGKTTSSVAFADAPRAIAWSADGSSVAFLMRVPEPARTLGAPVPRPAGAKWAEPPLVVEDLNFRIDGAGPTPRGHAHLFVMPAAGGAARQVTSGPYNDVAPLSWTPDGHGVLLLSNREKGWERMPGSISSASSAVSRIYRVNVTDGAYMALTDHLAPNREPLLSPDGTHIAWLSNTDKRVPVENERIHIMGSDGHDARVLGESLDLSVLNAQWAGDSRSLFFLYVDHGIAKVAQMSLDGKMTAVAEKLADGTFVDLPYSGGQFSVAANNAVAYTGAGDVRPPELFVTHAGKVRQITHLNDGMLSHVRLAKVRELPVTSSFDKRAIGAWELLPPDYSQAKKYPLILEIHGGPYLSYGPVFGLEHQLLAAAGYIVVYSNPRGSTSYGEAFANLIHNDYPSHDYDDLMSAVDAAIANGDVDANNLFVTGQSGGGVLSSWTVGMTHRFRAAAVRAPVINWTSWMLTSDMYSYAARYWFDKFPWEDQQSYWSHSSLSHVGNVTTPTVVLVGDQDLRTTVGDAEQFYQALQLRNVPSALVKFPGASHIVFRPSQTAQQMNAILAWFARYRAEGARAGS